MNDERNSVGSLLAGIMRWLGQLLPSRSPSEEPGGAIGPVEEPPAGPVAQAPVGQVLTSDRHPAIAVVDLGRDISGTLRDSWADGRRFESGGVIESAWLQPIFAAGSTAASSLAAGNVFLATADPNTLMVIGKGVSTAVMSGERIIRHAPFIAAGSAILPVVAPLMLFTTVSSLVTSARLDRIQRALGTLSEVLARVRQVEEAETYAEFQTGTKLLDEIWSQFEHSQRFTDAMKMELTQARRDTSRLHHKFGHLSTRKIGSEDDARTAALDISRFFLSSLIDIRADVLRLFLTVQDDPGYAELRQASLDEKFQQTKCRLNELLEEDPIEGFLDELQRELDEVGWWPPWLVRRLRARIAKVETIRDDFGPIRERVERWTGAADSANGTAHDPSLVVYRASDGNLHARHTQDLRLQPTPR